MLDFIRQGGVPSLVLLVFGLVGLIGAALFAWSPNEARLPALHAVVKVIFYTVLMGTMASLHAVSRYVATLEANESIGTVLVVGVGEAMTIGVLGFGVLSFIYILIAVGHRRAGR